MKRWLPICFFLLVFTSEGRSANKMETLNLPVPRFKGEVSLEETIFMRRSVRSFSGTELTLEEISQLLWAGQGITQNSTGFRASPSAGATYPLGLYMMNKDGIYRYVPRGHKLTLIRRGDLRFSLSRAALGQTFIGKAPVDIIITAVYPRTTRRYGQRGIRYVHIEVGHVAENIHLQAVAMGLGSVPVGAFSDDEVRRVLSIAEEEVPLYIIPVGHIEK